MNRSRFLLLVFFIFLFLMNIGSVLMGQTTRLVYVVGNGIDLKSAKDVGLDGIYVGTASEVPNDVDVIILGGANAENGVDATEMADLSNRNCRPIRLWGISISATRAAIAGYMKLAASLAPSLTPFDNVDYSQNYSGNSATIDGIDSTPTTDPKNANKDPRFLHHTRPIIP